MPRWRIEWTGPIAYLHIVWRGRSWIITLNRTPSHTGAGKWAW